MAFLRLSRAINPSDSLSSQFMRYVVVGGVATVFDFGTLVLLVSGLAVHYLLGNACAFVIGITVNYVLSTRWVFRTRNVANRPVEFLVFAIVGVVGLGVSQIVMFVGVEWMGSPYQFAKVLAVGIQFFWNFGARKLLLFRNKPVAVTVANPVEKQPEVGTDG